MKKQPMIELAAGMAHNFVDSAASHQLHKANCDVCEAGEPCEVGDGLKAKAKDVGMTAAKLFMRGFLGGDK